MTGQWRAIWDVPGTPFPAHADFDNEAGAHLFALRKSREIAAEVAVVALEGAENGPESRSAGQTGVSACGWTSETTNEGER